MRTLFFLVFLAGCILAFGYPAAIEALSSRVIAAQALYSDGGSFQPVEIELAAEQAPLRIDVEIQARGTQFPEYGGVDLQVSRNGRSELESALDIRAFEIVSEGVEGSGAVLRTTAGVLQSLSSGTYRFEASGRDYNTAGISQIGIILRANALQEDKRIAPMGYVLTAIGLVGFLMAVRRHRVRGKVATRSNPRWGRGAKD